MKERKKERKKASKQATGVRSQMSNFHYQKYSGNYLQVYWIFLNFFKFIYDSHRERERGREIGRWSSRLHVGFDPGSPRSHPGPKAGTKPLSHPGILRFFKFKICLTYWIVCMATIFIISTKIFAKKPIKKERFLCCLDLLCLSADFR